MPPGHGLQGITARREIRSINHTAWRNATKQPFVRTCAVRRRQGLFIQPTCRSQGGARYCSWCQQSSSGHPEELPSREPALTAADTKQASHPFPAGAATLGGCRMPDPVSRLQLVQLVDKDVTIEVGRDAVQESLMLSVIAVAPPCQSCVQNHRGRSSCRCC